GGHRVLDGEVDADAADRGHRVRRVADAQQARPVPAVEAVHPDGEQLDLVPVADLLDPVGEERPETGHGFLELGQPTLLDLVEGALRDHPGALPARTPVDHHHDPAPVEGAARVLRVARFAGDPEPEHVDGCAVLLQRQGGPLAQYRGPAVGGDHQVGVDLHRPVRPGGPYAGDGAVAGPASGDGVGPGDQVGRLGAAQQVEGRVLRCLAAEELQEVPLRDEGDVRRGDRQVAEVADDHVPAGDAPVDPVRLLVRQFQELGQQAQLVQDLQRRRVDGVAAEVAEEVGVLLQDGDVDPGPGQQQPEDHAGGPAADDAARGLDGVHRYPRSSIHRPLNYARE